MYHVTYYHRTHNMWMGPFRFFTLQGAHICASVHEDRTEVGQVEIWEDTAPGDSDSPRDLIWTASDGGKDVPRVSA